MATKAELIAGVAEKTGVTKAQAGDVVEAVFESIAGELSRGNDVAIAGFGRVEVRQSAARQGRNPQTGETINIAASKKPAFKAGKALKDRVA